MRRNTSVQIESVGDSLWLRGEGTLSRASPGGCAFGGVRSEDLSTIMDNDPGVRGHLQHGLDTTATSHAEQCVKVVGRREVSGTRALRSDFGL